MTDTDEKLLHLVYMTGKNKYLNKHDAFQIINMIKGVAAENNDWLELIVPNDWNITIIEKDAQSLSEGFAFSTSYHYNPSDEAAKILDGKKEFRNRVSMGGRLEAASCEIQTIKFKEIVEHITEEMNRITKGKFDYHWV